MSDRPNVADVADLCRSCMQTYTSSRAARMGTSITAQLHNIYPKWAARESESHERERERERERRRVHHTRIGMVNLQINDYSMLRHIQTRPSDYYYTPCSLQIAFTQAVDDDFSVCHADTFMLAA